MAELVDQIKARLTIEDLVGQYVELKKAGRNLKGLCPFHSEKTPSFVVSPEKQICHCFGCAKGGDIFAFTEEVEGVSFREALELLADKVGLKDEVQKQKSGPGKTEKDLYYKAHQLASEFFEKTLHESSDGKKVLDYLHRRGVNDDTIKEFKLGFAPDKYDSLYPMLLKKGIPKAVLVKSGLASSKNLASDSIYDKYRSRLIFPIFNYTGKICGFGGRALKKDQMPKYLNSAENAIYNKSKVLYGLSHAKKFVKEQDSVLIVEGYFDVILPYQEGIKNVVASSGTALSSDQVKRVKRITSNVVSCFDTDDAGFEATRRSYFLFQKAGIDMRTVEGLDKKDPADFVRENGEQFLKLIADAPSFINFFVNRLSQNIDLKSLTARRMIIAELSPCFKVMSPSDKDFFLRDLATRLGMREQSLYDEVENAKLPASHPAKIEKVSAEVVKVQKLLVPELIIGLILMYPKLMDSVGEVLAEKDFDGDLKGVYKGLTDQYNSSRDISDGWDLFNGFNPAVSQKLNILLLRIEDKYMDFAELALKSELDKLIDKLRKDRKKGNLENIRSRIIEAEKEGSMEKMKKLLKEQQELLSN
jgi:DNA primase